MLLNSGAIFRILFYFRYETGHQAISDGRSYPNFNQEIIGVYSGGLNVEVVVVECGNNHIHQEYHPQITLGISLPFLAGIEECQHEKQPDREEKTNHMQGVNGQSSSPASCIPNL